ncbi:MAG: peptide chain release factor 1 [Saprospiraceae bacterium]|nr:MAG: peptide chain release factor 1 [Saprospiraceae bacterium]
MILEKLEAIYDRYNYLEEQMSDPSALADMERYTKIGKEYKDLKVVVETYLEYRDLLTNIKTAKEMLNDKEMKELAEMELEELEPLREEMEEKIKMLLIPKDPDDDKDVIFEIRSGTGGDEASLFVGDLYRMYSRYFDSQGWSAEVVSANEGTAGGYKELVMEVSGEEVYGKLKFESGGHRVQRVPKTESQGRVHTSAATVAVMPKIEPEEINVRRDELRYDVFRASGAGGQHVNRTESAVRIVHIPTGIVSESQDSRSQIKNREIALQRLMVKIVEVQRKEEASTVAAQRRLQVGSGDRSEKIRTYNFPQNRLTDHRINLTLYNLDQVMDGQIGDIIEALQVADNADKMKTGEE